MKVVKQSSHHRKQHWLAASSVCIVWVWQNNCQSQTGQNFWASLPILIAEAIIKYKSQVQIFLSFLFVCCHFLQQNNTSYFGPAKLQFYVNKRFFSSSNGQFSWSWYSSAAVIWFGVETAVLRHLTITVFDEPFVTLANNFYNHLSKPTDSKSIEFAKSLILCLVFFFKTVIILNNKIFWFPFPLCV